MNLFLSYSFISPQRNIPNILWCDWPDEVVIERLQRFPEWYERFWLKHEESSIRNADIVYSLFPVCAENMSRRYSREVAYLNRNVVNTVSDERYELDDDEVMQRYSAGKILFIGNKNYRDAALKLIADFTQLQSKNPHLELHIVGMNATDLNVSNPQIVCYGYLNKNSDVQRETYYNLLRSSLVIVNPAAKWGAFSSIVEAMYYGTPVIISPYEDFIVTFGDNINFGYYLSETTTLQALMQKIISCPYDEYKAMSAAACACVADWTWDNYVRAFCDDLTERGILPEIL